MTAAIGLVGVMVGAIIAAVSQLWVRRHQSRERWLGELFESCAEIYAVEMLYRVALWDCYEKGDEGPLKDWPRERRRLSEGKIALLITDEGLKQAMTGLTDTARACYRAAIAHDTSFEALATSHRAAIETFGGEARRVLRTGRLF